MKLTNEQLLEINDYIELLENKSQEEKLELFYMWSVTGLLDPNEHKLLMFFIINNE